MCRTLAKFDINELEKAIRSSGSFLLNINKNDIALSWRVSPKRTRSYPYARIYDTLGFAGKKITIIPFMKDEGKDGDRDFIQWDTISLMSLLGIYVIIAYYKNASKNEQYDNKITAQQFDYTYIKCKVIEILSFQSDSLHWNIQQIAKIDEPASLAISNYMELSYLLKVSMHSYDLAKKRIDKIKADKSKFMLFSRILAEKAQKREATTIQPKENIGKTKGTITINNYLGGFYFFTSDEIRKEKDIIYLVECKHSIRGSLPALEDIKDGLLKMVLFSNIKYIIFRNKSYKSTAVLHLSSLLENKKESSKDLIKQIKAEATINDFIFECE